MERYLIRYRYGKGSLWAFVLADSEEQILETFRDIEVHREPPDWFTAELESIVATHRIDAPAGWLPLVLRKPRRTKDT